MEVVHAKAPGFLHLDAAPTPAFPIRRQPSSTSVTARSCPARDVHGAFVATYSSGYDPQCPAQCERTSSGARRRFLRALRSKIVTDHRPQSARRHLRRSSRTTTSIPVSRRSCAVLDVRNPTVCTTLSRRGHVRASGRRDVRTIAMTCTPAIQRFARFCTCVFSAASAVTASGSPSRCTLFFGQLLALLRRCICAYVATA